jgi:hypothetical protein
MQATKRTQNKYSSGRLVLCKAFLAIAAVCLDSAARRCDEPLGFCFAKSCPVLGAKINMNTCEQPL